MTNVAHVPTGAGGLLRDWRRRRRMSQLDLATGAQVSTRHLSYVETGRSAPSRELLMHLARHLDVPLREQNDLLLAAGYSPAFSELDLDDPAMRPIVVAIDAILTGSAPNPTLVMDRHWNLVRANDAVVTMIAGVGADLLGSNPNVLRLTLHHEGLAPFIVNFDAVAAHLVHRVRRQHAISGDPVLAELVTEMETLAPQTRDVHPLNSNAALELHMRRDGVDARFLSVVSTFGTALDITASELTIETFYAID